MTRLVCSIQILVLLIEIALHWILDTVHDVTSCTSFPCHSMNLSKIYKHHLKDTFFDRDIMQTKNINTPSTNNINYAHAVDVLYGRGNHLVMHPGNIFYRSLVDALAEYYVGFPKDKKKLVSELVYEAIQTQTPPGRFLAENKVGQYTELDVDKAIRKISQCFREKQPMIKAAGISVNKMNSEALVQKIHEMRVRFSLLYMVKISNN